MWSEPIVRLPERVCFTLAEAGMLLSTADYAVEQAPAWSAAARDARLTQDLIVGRLWPGLGDLLADNAKGESYRADHAGR